MVEKRKFAGNMEMLLNCNHYISNYSLLLWEIYKLQFSIASSVTVHAYVTSNGICRGFAFKYGKFPLPLRYRTALSVPKVPTHVQ